MKKVTIIGVGMGTEKTLTIEAKEAIEQAEFMIGAKRIVQNFLLKDKKHKEEYDAFKIAKLIEESKLNNIAVLMSGDTGFFSGTEKLIPLLKTVSITILPGISCLSYFCAKVGISWQDMKIISLHGRKGNFIQAVAENEKTFVVTSGEINDMCLELTKAGFGDCEVWAGELLSYEEERIVHKKVKDMAEENFLSLSVCLIKNHKRDRSYTYGLPEKYFVTGKAPITKSEVRAVTMSKLALKKNDIVYDIGAGTGSVSVEMALAAEEGKVYAVEYKDTAIELIEKNKERFGIYNIEIVKGMAPDMLSELPVPDAAFIGGSKGRMEEVIKALIIKNPLIHIVINAISLETISETLHFMEKYRFINVEIVQISIAKAKNLGEYHMMLGQNPVFIITGTANGGIMENEN